MLKSAIRMLCDAGVTSSAVVDVTTGRMPTYRRGDTVGVTVLLVSGGVPVATADLGAIVLSVRPMTAPENGEETSFLSVVATGSQIADFTGTSGELEAWEAGGPGHATFVIPSLRGIFPQGSYRLHVRGTATDESEVTYLSTQLDVKNPAGVKGNDISELVLVLSGAITGQVAELESTATDAAAAATAASVTATAAVTAVEDLTAALANLATQPEAEAGVSNTAIMTALRVAQAIDASLAIVHRSGDESIAGKKTFEGEATFNGLIRQPSQVYESDYVPNLRQVLSLLNQMVFPDVSFFPNVSGATPGASRNLAHGFYYLVYGPGLASWKTKFAWMPVTTVGFGVIQVTAAVRLQNPQKNTMLHGVALYSSTADIVVTIGFREPGMYMVQRATASTGARLSDTQAATTCWQYANWIQVLYNPTTASYQVALSTDGYTWWVMGTYTAAALFGGTNKADRVGIGMSTNEVTTVDLSMVATYFDVQTY